VVVANATLPSDALRLARGWVLFGYRSAGKPGKDEVARWSACPCTRQAWARVRYPQAPVLTRAAPEASLTLRRGIRPIPVPPGACQKGAVAPLAERRRTTPDKGGEEEKLADLPGCVVAIALSGALIRRTLACGYAHHFGARTTSHRTTPERQLAPSSHAARTLSQSIPKVERGRRAQCRAERLLQSGCAACRITARP
jgi:hypothetical protein